MKSAKSTTCAKSTKKISKSAINAKNYKTLK